MLAITRLSVPHSTSCDLHLVRPPQWRLTSLWHSLVFTMTRPWTWRRISTCTTNPGWNPFISLRWAFNSLVASPDLLLPVQWCPSSPTNSWSGNSNNLWSLWGVINNSCHSKVFTTVRLFVIFVVWEYWKNIFWYKKKFNFFVNFLLFLGCIKSLIFSSLKRGMNFMHYAFCALRI